MTRDEIEACVRGFFRSRITNDLDSVMRWWAPSATMRLAGSAEASRIARSTESDDALRALFSELVQAWRFHSVDIRELVIEGDRAAVHHRTRITFVPTGQEFETEMFDLMRFEGGRIVSMIEFLDTALADRLVASIAP